MKFARLKYQENIIRKDKDSENRAPQSVDLLIPVPGLNDVIVNVLARGICRIELDQIEGRIVSTKLPIFPGHQPVGIVANTAKKAKKFKIGERVGAIESIYRL